MSEYLAHYGVKGMKWGKRKNKDILSEYMKDQNDMIDYHLDLIADKVSRDKDGKISKSTRDFIIQVNKMVNDGDRFRDERLRKAHINIGKRLATSARSRMSEKMKKDMDSVRSMDLVTKLLYLDEMAKAAEEMNKQEKRK